ncbi:MAG: DUF6353 family protein [Sarcina sp.]
MKNIQTILKKNYRCAELFVKKNSPEILSGIGAVSIVAGTVMACKSTLKLSDTLEETKTNLEAIKVASEREDYTEEDKTKDLTITYGQAAMKVIKLYAAPVLITTTGISCMLTSNKILRNRNAALTAAYVTIDKSFKEYRARVADKYGKDAEFRIRHNIQDFEIGDISVLEDGTEVITTEKGLTMPQGSDYMRVFDEFNPNYQRDAQYNLMFLRSQQQYLNDKLQVNGILFLNDVYDALGFPRTKAGQVVGWTYNFGEENADNYIDFGLTNLADPKIRDFINGYENSIWLDFNVDGPVWDKI